jgi:hypothetical protein
MYSRIYLKIKFISRAQIMGLEERMNTIPGIKV